jgi:hypothetical protein
MDVDTTPVKNEVANSYFGTKRYIKTVQPTNPSNPKSIEELYEEYKQFSLLKKKDEMMTNPEAGTPAYLISSDWLNRYMKFILYYQFKDDVAEHNLKIDLETHFTQKHPGLINNDQELCEEDRNCENLYGTGQFKGMEQDYIDTYVDYNKQTSKDFYILNEEIWQFVFFKYGG